MNLMTPLWVVARNPTAAAGHPSITTGRRSDRWRATAPQRATNCRQAIVALRVTGRTRDPCVARAVGRVAQRTGDERQPRNKRESRDERAGRIQDVYNDRCDHRRPSGDSLHSSGRSCLALYQSDDTDMEDEVEGNDPPHTDSFYQAINSTIMALHQSVVRDSS